MKKIRLFAAIAILMTFAMTGCNFGGNIFNNSNGTSSNGNSSDNKDGSEKEPDQDNPLGTNDDETVVIDLDAMTQSQINKISFQKGMTYKVKGSKGGTKLTKLFNKMTDLTFLINVDLSDLQITQFTDNLGCHSCIQNLVLPKTLKTMGTFSFLKNSSLKSIVFYDKLTDLGGYGFMAQKLESIHVIGENPIYKSIDGVLYAKYTWKDAWYLCQCPLRKTGEVNIEEGTVAVAGGDGQGFGSGITKIVIPLSVTEIPEGAFEKATNATIYVAFKKTAPEGWADDWNKYCKEVVYNQNGPDTPSVTVNKETASWTGEEKRKALTASNLDLFTADEIDVYYYCNLARVNGKKFLELVAKPYVADSKNGYDENDSYVKSLYADLEALSDDLPMLSPDKDLCEAAAAHAEDMIANNIFQHGSSDGTDCFTRIKKYYKDSTYGENLAARTNGTALQLVMDLLIDKGIEGAGHRKNILNRNFRAMGVSVKSGHPTYGNVCVQDFGGSVLNPSEN